MNVQNALPESKRNDFLTQLSINLYENTKFKDISSDTDQISSLGILSIEATEIYHFLRLMELIYAKSGHHDKYYQICDRLKEINRKNIQDIESVQLYPKKAELPELNEKLELVDNFNSISSDWEWIDPKGDCTCELNQGSEKGIIISVTGDHDFWSDGVYRNFNAPHLLQEISGDFILETKIADGDKGKKSGGLLVLKDDKSFLRFEMPSSSFWEGEVRFEVHSNYQLYTAGRGFFDADQLILRLIRQGDRFSAYCSRDGIEWFTCGYLDLPMNDPIKVGIIHFVPIKMHQ